MKNDIMVTLTAILNTLDHVSVTGKTNMQHLTNSMTALEQVMKQLQDCEITPADIEE